MSFTTTLALLAGLLAALPVLAHLLRRGKTIEQEFPGARLVPVVPVTSDRRSRLEDRALLSLRALMVLGLAVLGATPFVRCSRLSVDRPSGASVALAIVVDDSQSMRANLGSGGSRFDNAVQGAKQLLDSAREGDAVAILLAGKPARLLLSATPDLTLARRTLDSLHVTDRSTDLGEAVQLARSALKELPHVEKRVVLLSDLGDRELPAGEPPVWAPLSALSNEVNNCGIASAERQGRGVSVTVGCNTTEATHGRTLELHLADDPAGKALASLPLPPISGEQKLTLEVASFDFALGAELTGDDAIVRDNHALVAAQVVGLRVAVFADTARATVVTGGATVIEQALGALDETLDVKPLGSLPESSEDLASYAAFIVDDPTGLSPEARNALTTWVTQGGILLGLLGPALMSAELASSIEPFARQGAPWESESGKTLDPASLAWLGEDAGTLTKLDSRGRVRLDASDLPGTHIVGRWNDGVPWLFRRTLGRGLILSAGLPASVEYSDFALRPGFLALLDHALSAARQHRGPSSSPAGVAWVFSAEDRPLVSGPSNGNAEVPRLQVVPSSASQSQQVIPELTGLYQVEAGGRKEARVVVLDSTELTQGTNHFSGSKQGSTNAEQANQVDASPEWALLILGLFAVELFVRMFGQRLLPLLRRRQTG